MADIQAHLSDGRVLHFPDGTQPEVIQATVKKMVGSQAGSTSVPTGNQNTSYGFGGGTPPDPNKMERLKSGLDWMETPLLNVPKSHAEAQTEAEAQQAVNKGSPWEAAYKTYAAGAENSARNLVSGMTSPVSALATLLSFGESLPAKLGLSAIGGWYGTKGAIQAATPQQPGETAPDAMERRLMGGAQAVGGMIPATGSAETAVGNHIAKKFGLSSDYADTVANRVKDIAAARQQESAELSKAHGAALKGAQALDAAKQQAVTNVQTQLEAELRTLEQATGARVSAIRDRGESDISAANQEHQQNVVGAKAKAQQSTQDINNQIAANQQKYRQAGENVLRDTAKAVFEEHARVQQPFIEIGQQLNQPVSDSGTVMGIIRQSFADAGAKDTEIPSASTKALGKVSGGEPTAFISGNRMPLSRMSEAQRAILQPSDIEGGSQPVSFNDLTRLKEDLNNAASASKDGVVRHALSSAYEQIDAMQEKAATDAGLGDKYKAAKNDYMLFKRSAGSGLMNDMLSAKDVEEQQIAPKLAKLTSKQSGDALRVILKTLGVDTKPLDDILNDNATLKQQARDIPSQTREAIQDSKAQSIDKIRQIKGRTSSYLTAEKQAHTQQAGAIQQKMEAANELGKQFDAGKKSVFRAEGERAANIRDIANAKVNQSNAKGEIVPGKTSSELAGMSNEQINAERMRGLLNASRSKGVGNPLAMMSIVYGLTKIFSGNPFGLATAGYGVARMSAPDLMASPKFQRWVLKTSGISPRSPAATALIRGLKGAAPILQSSSRVRRGTH